MAESSLIATKDEDSELDPLVFGYRLRHLRRERGLTLTQLGDRVGRQASYLSMIENGKREPRLSLIHALATALEVTPSHLLSAQAPGRRARLEIELERAQHHRLYREMNLPYLKPSARVPDDVLEHLVRLFDELKSRAQVRAATPEEARKGNAALRQEMRERDNYFPEIEAVANESLTAIGHSGGQALSQRVLVELARHFGFSLHVVQEMPASVRSVTDLRHHRIYIPQRDEMESRNARSVVLQTLGHFALRHEDPRDFGEFLRQRVEANYFAGAVLVPERTAVPMLQAAKKARDLSVQDLEEVFNVSYEMAAHRFTNLATRHLEIPVHFTRSDEEGLIWKAYENDGVPFPQDPDGAIEGQRLCREWGTRQVFSSADKFALHYQYTDTMVGTYWCVSYVEADRNPPGAVTVGTRFSDAQYFRGRDTRRRSTSACPDAICCRQPPGPLASRWGGLAWPSPRPHSHVLAALPAGTFPGVDLTEVYEFLDRQTGS